MIKNKKVAIMYDFDKTLSSKYMSEFGLIKLLGFEKNSEFWNFCNNILAKNYNMDNNLAFLLGNLMKAKENNIPLTKEFFQKQGREIKFFPGVEKWFERINTYGKSLGLEIEHYIISSGIEEIIQGTSINKHFTKVFASSFVYNDKGEAFWPRVVVNYTGKTQYIFRIKKYLIEDLTDDKTINKKYNASKNIIPYENMIYLGDGETDVPCMKLIKEKGGHSICLYEENDKSKNTASNILSDDRVNIIALADYTENSDLDNYIKNILNKIANK